MQARTNFNIEGSLENVMFYPILKCDVENVNIKNVRSMVYINVVSIPEL
jgi:hypothetical protein